MRKINSKIGSSLWSVTSNLLSRAVTFLFTPIFIRLLSPEEYGIYSLYVSLMGIFTVLTTFEISGSVMYRGLSKFEERSKSFLSSALGAALTLNFLTFTLYIIFREKVNDITSLDTRRTLFLFAQIFLNTAVGIYFAEKRYIGDYKRVALVNMATGITSPILALCFIRLGGGGESRITAPLIVYTIFGLPIIFSLFKSGKRLFSREVWKFIFGITVPMLPHFLSLSLIAQSDKIIIAKTLGDGELGKYSAAHSVGFMLSLVTNGILLVLSPWTVKKQKLHDTRGISLALTDLTKLICFLTLLFLSFLPEAFRIIAKGDYFDAESAAYPVALSVVFLFLGSAAQSCLIHYDKPLLITKNSVISASVCLVLNLFLIGRAGYIGGAFSTLLSYLLLFLLNRKTLKRLSENGIDLNISRYFWLSFISSSLLIFLLRHSLASRIILLFAITLSFVPELKRCKRVLS